MKTGFGIHLPIHGQFDFHSILKTSLFADEMGYQTLWLGDHFFLPARNYKRIGGDPEKPDKLDAWTVLSAIAAKTEKISLATRVSPLPFYLPARLAKMVTTVDIVSKGRTILGVGAGWHKEEAVSYGLPWSDLQTRIDKMHECLKIIIKLWTEERATFEGRYYDIKNAPFWPKPVQKPHPQIFLGGNNPRLLKAVSRHGNGWVPNTNMPLETFKKYVSIIEDEAKIIKKPLFDIKYAIALSYPNGLGKEPTEWIQNTKKWFENNATEIILDISGSPLNPQETDNFLEKFTQKVVTQFL